ncbi:hypothetical protein GCM10011506_06380 [Marivirga lumbricoides]|uniref:Pyridoxamine 5'-phosphate oxidase family protein n=1 Tax=Marivirga lumbricoides TaxID=1046115 RepID=A0A2T4DUY4_9BACT|nr:hypothetical protein C9994_01955 [Marivirga lumbricoides]GGC23898.1 hypothetical protein GCM10011506_06380 [Marivirga lumbricoides]
MKSVDQHTKTKKELIFDFIQANPIANIIVSGNDFLTTTVPILTKGTADEFVLYGHMAKHNAQYKYLENKKRALIIFQEKDLCTSALDTPEAQSETEFSAVHINGELKLQTEEELRSSLEKTFERLRLFYGKENTCTEKINTIIERQMHLITGFWCYPNLTSPVSRLVQ